MTAKEIRLLCTTGARRMNRIPLRPLESDSSRFTSNRVLIFRVNLFSRG